VTWRFRYHRPLGYPLSDFKTRKAGTAWAGKCPVWSAQLLGLTRKGLYLKRQRLGLEPGAAVPVVTTTGAKGALEDDCLPD